jgi:hypothetical protein
VFTREFLTKSNDCPPCDFSVSPIEDKMKGRHFDKTEVIKAELQAVLNTPTEHDFQDVFKK